MNFKYTTTIVLILMILALARGFSLHYENLFSLGATHALADGGGGGGAGGGDGGGGGGAGGGDGGGGGGAGGGTGGTGGGGGAVSGCTDPTATNYNPSATIDDGSCTYAPPAAPTFSAVCAPQSDGTFSIAMSWNAVTGADNYPVRISGTSHATGDSGGFPIKHLNPSNPMEDDIGQGMLGDAPTGTSITWTGLTTSGNYTYWGHAWAQKGGWSSDSPKTVTCTPPPAAPVISGVCTLQSNGTYSVALNWSPVSGATNYPMRLQGPSFATNATQYQGASVVGFGAVGDGAPTGTSFTFVGLTASGAYSFWGHAWSSTAGWSQKGSGTVNCAPPVTPPVPTCKLTPSPATIQSGSSSTLSWTMTNGTSISASGIGSSSNATGSVSVTPSVTTTYTATVTGSGGSATCSATVTVTTTPSPPVPTCTLSASPSTIQSGGSSTLSWTTSNATSFSINQGIGAVTPLASGAKTVIPGSTITYTGTATGSGGTTTTCTATVTVTSLTPAPSCNLSAAPTLIQSGDSSMLSWTTANATSFSINQGIGSVTPVASGSHSVSPTATTTYIGTATGAGGTATCSVRVRVQTTPPPPGSPSCTLKASPTTVNPGGHTTLTWTSVNPDHLTIDNGIGPVTPAIGGSVLSGTINANTTFTATVVSPTGQTATCTTNVTIGGGSGGPSCSMNVTPSTITTGGTATLSWGGSGISTVDIDNGVATATSSPGSAIVGPTAVQGYTYTGTFHATNGQTLTCSATLTVTSAGGGAGGGGGGGAGGGGGGGGAGGASPTITLAALAHVGSQPLTYLYLSQIPYTGLDLGPIGTIVYWLVLIAASLALAYLVLFGAVPFVNRSMQEFGMRVSELLNAERLAPAAVSIPSPVPAASHAAPVAPKPALRVAEAPRGYSSYDGFKSFAHKGALSIEDIVKGLTREHSAVAAAAHAAHAEPIYENVEPIAPVAAVSEPVPSPIQMTHESIETVAIPADVKGFAAALLEGDRAGVFAGLRQHLRGGGTAEKLLSDVTCLLDDVYRARIDGTACDGDLSRLAARFSTPTLEKLVSSLTTAIDSSYSVDVTGAKLALTRALVALGA